MRQPPRKLTVLASIDVAGYTRLVRQDERGTLGELAAIREAILAPLLAQYSGDMFKTMGDGGLIEFPNVEDSVRWALDFQSAMAERNRGRADKAIMSRLAIALADVIVAGDDRYGAAVAFVVRLQEASPPGGVVITHSVRWQLLKALASRFSKMEPLALKSIDEPIEAWCWVPDGVVPVVAPAFRVTQAAAAPGRPAHAKDGPSVAVLAFDALSGDPETENIADGVVEEITATLSRIRDFTVVARNSAYVYKGRAHDLRSVGRALGVRYLLEGSVRKRGNDVRVTAQLIDAETGGHLWADSYRVVVDSIFDLEDRIATAVAGALRPSIRAAEIEAARHKRPNSMAAYDLTLTALPYLWSQRPEDGEQAVALLDQAVAIDATYARAVALAAWARAQQVAFGWAADPEATRRDGMRLAEQAVATASDDPTALTALGSAVMMLSGDLDRAQAFVDRALSLDPNNAWAWARRGFLMIYRGDHQAATESFERAIALSPLDPFSYNSYAGLAVAAFAAGDADKAVEWMRRVLSERVGMAWAERDLAAFLAAAGRLDEAKAAVRRLLAAHPKTTLRQVTEALPFMAGAMRTRYLDGLKAAGVPE
jgi:adenylate cyclase